MRKTQKITKIEDTVWDTHAKENALHRAKIFIDLGQHKKAADALKEIEYKKAISFLYEIGRKYLHHHDKRALNVVKTRELIKTPKKYQSKFQASLVH